MELILKSVIAALLALLLGAVIYIQRDALNTAKERIKRDEKTVFALGDTIMQLRAAAATSKKAAAKLQADQERIVATLSERERQLERLQYENIAIRTWADTALPDAVAGMRRRAAATGATAFINQRLPVVDTVQPVSGSAQD